MSGLATTGRREATKAANRAAILAAGREVFSELGYGAASVRDVVRRTDLAAGTFYNYFPDKDAIFAALVRQAGEEARRRVRAARRSADERGAVGGLRALAAPGHRAAPRLRSRSTPST